MTSKPFQKALQALVVAVEQCQVTGAVQLPSLYALSRRAGVSHQVVRRAVARLESQGQLTTVPRRGVFIRAGGGAQHAPAPLGEPLPSDTEPADRILDRIRVDVLTGTFPPARPLPDYKALMQRYGSGYRRIRRALSSLTTETVLERYGRKFRPVSRVPALSTGKIVYVASVDAMDLLMTLSPRTPEFWRAFESRCTRNNVRIEVYSYLKAVGEFPWSGRKRMTVSAKDRDEPVLGYVLWTMGIGLNGLRRVLAEIAATGKPCAIMHDNVSLPFAEVAAIVRRHPRCRLFHFSVSTHSSLQMGLYLRELGHRHVALFYYPAGGLLWESRAGGIEQALRLRGEETSVLRFAIDGIATSEELRSHIQNWEFSRLLKDTEETLRKQCTFFDDYDERLSLLPLRGHTDKLFLQSAMVNVFRRALANPRITAWVGLGDPVASMACSFLHRQGVAVPGRISVVGFDDSIEAIGLGLTSYNFNMPGLVDAMVDYIYDSGGTPPRGEPLHVEIPGRVMHRFTCGPAGARR